MYRTQRSVAAVVYLVGVCGFGLYDILVRASTSVLDAIGYGAQWPLVLLRMV